MKILYFDCFSGISGDMTISSLVDAGGDPIHLESELKKLGMEDEYQLKWNKVVKNGITSTKFDVVLLNEEGHHHHHDHGHNEEGHHHHHGHGHNEEGHHHHHGHGHNEEGHHHHHDHGHNEEGHHHHHDHGHNEEDHHHHADDHGHHHSHEHHHAHDHRSYKDIVNLIKGAEFSETVEETALKIFRKIGEAEGRIHGMPLEDVHFHEVGAVDSIIDIVGTAILLHQMEIDLVISAPVPVGSGKIRIDHGIYPVPAPATLEILRGVPIAASELRAELTTPTGAAIIAVLAEEFGNMPTLKVDAIGYGAGTKTFPEHPNVLRTIVGERY
ncbi:LarC family nickel insertion protein [Oceanobacillus profundus]|uniref:LarC family nickel insertion protein n=1 Tax=Oceanobacillus profundus TaxID=372463 RepID=UPI0026E2AD53|nr:LarC family nickel insertion protein [Oceanobacillus profundus]MDO6450982.1 LarC family nickel insertion protein [Oceanobacillus profundus]